jgi:hypothetical protein
MRESASGVTSVERGKETQRNILHNIKKNAVNCGLRSADGFNFLYGHRQVKNIKTVMQCYAKETIGFSNNL